MKVTLNKNSWHYKFFKFMLEGVEPPKSLCPYFWILVGLIVCSPVIGLAALVIKIGKFLDSIVSKFVPKKQKKEKTLEEWEAEWRAQRLKRDAKAARMEKIGKFFGKIAIWVGLPSVLVLVIYGVYSNVVKLGWYHMLVGLGLCIVLAFGLFGIVKLFEWFFDRYFDTIGRGITKFAIFIFTPFKWIGWMIKAGYEKACPLVEWQGEDTEVKKDYHQFN